MFTALFALLTLGAAVGTAVGRWTHDTLFDTDAWLEVVGPISGDPLVSDALSSAVSWELIEFLDPTVRLQSLLPDLLDPLAVEIGTSVDELIIGETDEFFHSDLFDELWLGLNETAHTAAVAIIRDQVPFASTAGGVVAVDLEPLVVPINDSVVVRLESLGERIPDFILEQLDIDETVSSLIVEYETEGIPGESQQRGRVRIRSVGRGATDGGHLRSSGGIPSVADPRSGGDHRWVRSETLGHDPGAHLECGPGLASVRVHR